MLPLDIYTRLNNMPVRKVQTSRGGKPVTGYKWGESGKIYPTKKAAEAQGRAIYASGYKKK